MGRGIALSLAIVLGLAWLDAAPASAADGRRPLLAALFGRPAEVRVETPEGISVGPPGPQRYPEYGGGNYPWYGYGFGVPTYSWGYFGAHYRPMSVSHTGYYNQFVQWGYRRGY
jgi:hypothetical protein